MIRSIVARANGSPCVATGTSVPVACGPHSRLDRRPEATKRRPTAVEATTGCLPTHLSQELPLRGFALLGPVSPLPTPRRPRTVTQLGGAARAPRVAVLPSLVLLSVFSLFFPSLLLLLFSFLSLFLFFLLLSPLSSPLFFLLLFLFPFFPPFSSFFFSFSFLLSFPLLFLFLHLLCFFFLFFPLSFAFFFLLPLSVPGDRPRRVSQSSSRLSRSLSLARSALCSQPSLPRLAFDPVSVLVQQPESLAVSLSYRHHPLRPSIASSLSLPPLCLSAALSAPSLSLSAFSLPLFPLSLFFLFSSFSLFSSSPSSLFPLPFLFLPLLSFSPFSSSLSLSSLSLSSPFPSFLSLLSLFLFLSFSFFSLSLLSLLSLFFLFSPPFSPMGNRRSVRRREIE